MKKLRRSRERLNYSNEQLRKHVDELNETRSQLEEANGQLSLLYSDVKQNAQSLSQTNNAKEKYIADIFGLCSDYISKIDDFRNEYLSDDSRQTFRRGKRAYKITGAVTR